MGADRPFNKLFIVRAGVGFTKSREPIRDPPYHVHLDGHAKGSLLATALDTDPCSAGARGIPLQQLPNIKLVCLQAE